MVGENDSKAKLLRECQELREGVLFLLFVPPDSSFFG